jgi:hypothetical protein
VVEENYITVSGMTQIAINTVTASFNKYHNRLVIEALPPPILSRDETMALDKIIEDQFNAVGLGKYLHIIRKRERLLPKYEAKKKK